MDDDDDDDSYPQTSHLLYPSCIYIHEFTKGQVWDVQKGRQEGCMSDDMSDSISASEAGELATSSDSLDGRLTVVGAQ